MFSPFRKRGTVLWGQLVNSPPSGTFAPAKSTSRERILLPVGRHTQLMV
jgi:hypothetical protein